MSPKRILVPVDFSASQDLVVRQAAHLAKTMGAQLSLLHCAAPPELSVVSVEPIYVSPAVLDRFSRDHTAAVTGKMDELAAQLQDSIEVETLVRRTNPVGGIVSTARELNADFIVMGSHGAGLDRFLLGSVAENVTREAECPVIVVRGPDEISTFEKVVVGVDFSAFSMPLVAIARSLCPPQAEIHLVHTWQPPHLDTAHLFGDPGHESLYGALSEGLKQHSQELESFATALPEDSRYRLELRTGRPASTLLEYFEDVHADTIFVGAHDADRVENMLGSVSDRILRHAPMTVLLTEQARLRYS
jgi:nucleotide-binding universal stress UspA family protein